MSRFRKVVIGGFAVLVGGFILLQFFPIGVVSADLARHDAPVLTEIAWNSPEVAELVRAACYDCHSNETRYPFYSTVAPMAWLVNHDVNEGRAALNFSEQSANQIDPEELTEEVREGGMPLPIYLPMHPEANLTDAQRQTLIAGFAATLTGTESEGGERGAESGEGADND